MKGRGPAEKDSFRCFLLRLTAALVEATLTHFKWYVSELSEARARDRILGSDFVPWF